MHYQNQPHKHRCIDCFSFIRRVSYCTYVYLIYQRTDGIFVGKVYDLTNNVIFDDKNKKTLTILRKNSKDLDEWAFDTFQGIYKIQKTRELFQPAMIYLIIAGVVVMLIAVCLFIVCLSPFKSRYLPKIISATAMIGFGFQFAVGVYSSIICSYFRQYFKGIIELDSSIIDEYRKDFSYNSIIEYYDGINAALHMTEADAVLAFTVGVISMLALMMAQVDPHKQKTHANNSQNPQNFPQKDIKYEEPVVSCDRLK